MPTYPLTSLSVQERVSYLYERNYFTRGSIKDVHSTAIGQINFHYFLGYARNFRVLVDHGDLSAPKVPESVLGLIRVDHEMATLLHGGLRRAEWLLRSLAVQSYCDQFKATGTYLQTSQYTVSSLGSDVRIVERIIDSLLRYREPFVSDHVDQVARSLGVARPSGYDRGIHDVCVSLVEDLPLWAAVDSFSLGLLSRFITDCAPSGCSTPPWRGVAEGLEIRAPVFQTNIKALVFLRNLVAHHSRMWMRTTADSPKKPRVFERPLRDYHDKTMGVAFFNLALFQGPSERDSFAQLVMGTVQSDQNYKWGVSRLRKRP